MQVKKSAKVYDVVVIGSGAAGGMAAWNLTRQGVNVLMLDAGQRFKREEFWNHMLPYEERERRLKGEKPPEIYLDAKEQPYATPEDMPYNLTRVWGIGGKTNVWGRVSLRYSDLDFKSGELDGWEIPWPISYKDVAPYYDQVDQLIGVCGGTDDSEVLPGSKYHQPPPAMRCGEHRIKLAAGRLGIPVVPIRRATLTRNLRNFPACHYCGWCGRGCDTSSFFNAGDYLVTPALATKKLEIRNNAVVARILVDKEGRANGVQYFDRYTKQEHQVRARVVVVGASAIDSTRILLNSKSDVYPNGIGNGSDVIGRYLTEQVMVHGRAFLPELYNRAPMNEDGIGGEHMYMPRFNHKMRKRDFLRGYGVQFWGSGAVQPGASHYAKGLPGFGADFKKDVRRRYTGWVELHPFGEVLPYADNRVTVDETKVDQYGVPLAKITFHIRENERKMIADMYDTMEEILKEAKAEIFSLPRPEVAVPGSAIHEHSTVRMGADPKKSALNAFNQMHEVKNVFVVDGSAFTAASEKNPTLTILALCWRATDHLAEEMKKGNL
jgi:choline dehydrogenase-like flavoprotein